MVKFCLFDLGGVVIETKFEEIFAAYQQERGWDVDKLRDKIFSEKYELLLAGDLTLDQFIDWIKAEVNLTKAELEEFAADYYYSGEVKESVWRIIKKLKDNCQLGLVTNDIGRLDEKLSYLGLEGLFDRVINSFQVGYCKPSFEFYQAVLAELEVEPEEILFIDDDQQSQQVAAQLGIPVLDFAGVEQLEADLKELELIK